MRPFKPVSLPSHRMYMVSPDRLFERINTNDESADTAHFPLDIRRGHFAWKLPLNPLHQFRYANPKPLRQNLQKGQANILLASFNLGEVSTIYSELVRHFYLRQSFRDS